MPFDLVLPVLGWCFVAAWVFIGGMMVRDTLDHTRSLRFDPSEDLGNHSAAS